MELSEIRGRLDAVDDELTALFLRRMDLCEEVARYKGAHNLPVLSTSREREVLERIGRAAGDKERYARRLFAALFALSRSRQAELLSPPARVTEQVRSALDAGNPAFPETGRVACPDEGDAGLRAACGRLLPRGERIDVGSPAAAAAAVESGACQFGVLPAEKDAGVYALLRRGLHVVRRIRLEDSAAGSGCVRFFCVARDLTVYAGADRIGLLAACGGEGALWSVLSKPAALGLGVTELVRRPPADRTSEPVLFLEVKAGLRDPGILPMLEELERGGGAVQLLGGYKEVRA